MFGQNVPIEPSIPAVITKLGFRQRFAEAVSKDFDENLVGAFREYFDGRVSPSPSEIDCNGYGETGNHDVPTDQQVRYRYHLNRLQSFFVVVLLYALDGGRVQFTEGLLSPSDFS